MSQIFGALLLVDIAILSARIADDSSSASVRSERSQAQRLHDKQLYYYY